MSTDELPEGYKKGIPRVSNVVNFLYPFEGFAKDNYLLWIFKNRARMFWPEWWNIKQFRELSKFDDKNPDEYYELKGNKISLKWVNFIADTYTETACDWWTFIHLQMENHILGKPIEYGEHEVEIKAGITYLKALQALYPKDVIWLAEPVVMDWEERFQWSIDVVRINEKTKTVWLYDYKSWEVARKKYRLKTKLLKSWTPPRPTSKLKKLALQLSCYGTTYIQDGYSIWGIYWVWLHKTGTYEYEVEMWEKEKLDNLLELFGLNLDNIIIDDMFNIKITQPSCKYGTVKVSFNLDDLDNGKDSKENIANACKTAKVIANEMKEEPWK